MASTEARPWWRDWRGRPPGGRLSKRLTIVVIVVAVLCVGVSAWAYWHSQAETADARECVRWNRHVVAAFEAASTADEKAAVVVQARLDRPTACDDVGG